MRTIKRFFSLVPFLILWLMLSAFFWSWIFTFLTDTTPDKKVTLFTNAYQCRDVALAARLEQDMPDTIRMVKVHPFSYAMLDGSQLTIADLYVVKASDISEYQDWFAPAPAELIPMAPAVYELNGTVCGLRIYDAASGAGAGSGYITYTIPQAEPQDCYLFFGAHSLHLPGSDGALDSAAVDAARTLLTLP